MSLYVKLTLGYSSFLILTQQYTSRSYSNLSQPKHLPSISPAIVLKYPVPLPIFKNERPGFKSREPITSEYMHGADMCKCSCFQAKSLKNKLKKT